MKVLRGLDGPTESQTQAALADADCAGELACRRVKRRFKRQRQAWTAQADVMFCEARIECLQNSLTLKFNF